MLNFSNKIVEKTSKIRTENNAFTAVWENNAFYAKKGNTLYPIHEWDNLTLPSVKQGYTTPANDKHPVWTLKKPFNPNHSRPDIVKKYWAKYKPGLVLHGEVKEGVFYERSISKVDNE